MNLQVFWFVLIVVLWSGYFLLEGFDFGVGMLLPFVPRNEAERGAMFEWREKGESPRWRAVWLWANAIGSTGIALVWGIGLANLIHGVPLDSKGDYDGGLVDLFTPYTVLAGIAFVLLFAFHGASYLG